MSMICQREQLLLYAVTDRTWAARRAGAAQTAGARTEMRPKDGQEAGGKTVAAAESGRVRTEKSDTGAARDPVQEELLRQIRAALAGGITCLQLREKDLPRDALRQEAAAVRTLCSEAGVPLIIDDDVETALACGADGVHVGQDDLPVAAVRQRTGPDFIIGASAHNAAEARRAWQEGASYLGVGAAFGSATKHDARAIDWREYEEIRAAVPLPVVAIGGITEENLPQLASVPIDGIAVVSAVFGAADITAACRRLRTRAAALFGSAVPADPSARAGNPRL
ncbi:MAG: thiamine phosphate synthase [Anaerovoracaceae bacterium]|jgi:thiamine-phosphate pyrophosphorylase